MLLPCSALPAAPVQYGSRVVPSRGDWDSIVGEATEDSGASDRVRGTRTLSRPTVVPRVTRVLVEDDQWHPEMFTSATLPWHAHVFATRPSSLKRAVLPACSAASMAFRFAVRRVIPSKVTRSMSSEMMHGIPALFAAATCIPEIGCRLNPLLNSLFQSLGILSDLRQDVTHGFLDRFDSCLDIFANTFDLPLIVITKPLRKLWREVLPRIVWIKFWGAGVRSPEVLEFGPFDDVGELGQATGRGAECHAAPDGPLPPGRIMAGLVSGRCFDPGCCESRKVVINDIEDVRIRYHEPGKRSVRGSGYQRLEP